MTTQVIEPDPDAFRLPPLATPEALAEYTGGKIPASDPRAKTLLDGASAAVRRYCRWHVAPVLEETLTEDGPGGTVLHLPTGRLLSLVEVTDGGRPVELSTLDVSRAGMIERGAGWSARFGGVTARVRHGWDLAAVPDVSQIVLQVVANALSSPMGVTREQAGSISVSWAMTAPNTSGGLSLLERDLAVLNEYRI
ncbi:MAG: hypothetical protein QJR09_05275 [Micrococcus sp.]|nr:hypothetical protein [Micrococcus sp.]